MEAIDLTKILKEEHQGKWVIYSPSKMVVVAFDVDPIKASEKAKETKGATDLQMTKVLPFDQSFSPLV